MAGVENPSSRLEPWRGNMKIGLIGILPTILAMSMVVPGLSQVDGTLARGDSKEAEKMMSILDHCRDDTFPPTARQCAREPCVKVMPAVKAHLCFISGNSDPYSVAFDACSEKCGNECYYKIQAAKSGEDGSPPAMGINNDDFMICNRECISTCIHAGSKRAAAVHAEQEQIYASFLQKSAQRMDKNDASIHAANSKTSSDNTDGDDADDDDDDVMKEVEAAEEEEDPAARFARQAAAVKARHTAEAQTESKANAKTSGSDPWWLNPPPWWMPPPPEWGAMPSTVYSGYYGPVHQPAGSYPNLNGMNTIYTPQPYAH